MAKPASTEVVAQTFEVCTFIPRFGKINEGKASHDDVVVRLKLPSSRLRNVYALQQIAALVLPELVPAVLQIGIAKAQDGTDVEFSVSAFVPDAVSLDTMWNHLSNDQQSDIMDAVVNAMRKAIRS